MAATTVVGGDEENGYSAKVLSKVVDVWKPPVVQGNYTVELKVSIDGEGRVKQCIPLKSSSLEVFDQVACSAVYKAGPFGKPSYEAPIDVFLVFHLGDQDRKVKQELSDADAMRAEALARARAEREQARTKAGAVEEQARNRAMLAARSQGKDLPEVSPAPVAPPHHMSGKNVEKDVKRRATSGETGKNPPMEKNTNVAGQEKRKEAQKDHSRSSRHVSPSEGNGNGHTYGEGAAASASTDGNAPPPSQKQVRKEKYLALLQRSLNRIIYLPDTVPDGSYPLTVRVELDQNGVIQAAKVLKSSGDERVDKATSQSISAARTVPRPPKSIGTSFVVPVTASNRFPKKK
ncbi:MAG: TonB family protein [Desulfovibrio sp.]|nr:TonB family protein [Desulfovibrio sp.]